MVGTDEETVPAEHRRYRQYQRDLAAVNDKAEPELVATVLRDPDKVMAEAAISGHFDKRAPQLMHLDGTHFDQWATTMSELIADHNFLARRLREWTLLKSIILGHTWIPEEVVAASDWLQRKALDLITEADALAMLAEQGRTRRVRNAADRKLRRGKARLD
ncbi:hypothetical protein NONI108955_06370 [Nocardia ninae]|uniref:Uncharacterized protein n=1 Tax=Nocardia ninae NBRC 108245 TaxID=1210091 RepID=A0A511MFP5_9NOCA|nr:hypothetical protein [Nocardia ninae]GEM38908.1 hypothetical protein NN4_34270 [Nocardia ninae NBRC 108245]